MRVIMEQGDWLYVVIPRPEHASDWLMDPEGDYGYVKKADVTIAALPIRLDWMTD